ncbi:MAG: amidohydrolase family protein [Thalassobaculaceae bacterium]|nr:amidohydrolase family protein [Thalassobaculaceae bacterium]
MATGKVLTGGRVLDLDTGTLRAADIVIADGAIEAVVDAGAVTAEDRPRLDVTGKLIHIGLVNAHTHGHGALARGLGDKWTLELLLAAGPWIYGSQSLEDMRLCAMINAAEMLLKGCTACYDLYAEFPLPSRDGLDAIADGYSTVGLRAVVAPMVADTAFHLAVPGLQEALPPGLRRDMEAVRAQPAERLLSHLEDLCRHWRHDGAHVQLAMAPTIPLHCSDDFYAGCCRLAAEHGLGVHSHIAESKVQSVASKQRYGRTIISHLDKLGVLSPRFTAAHAVWLTDDDRSLMADHGCTIAHNPGSNLRLGNGLADIRSAIDRNITVGIGTDGSSCSDNQNMYEAMRFASFVSKGQTPSIDDWLSTLEVASAATLGGAKALGLGGRLGRVAPGYQADLVFLDTHNPNWIPVNDAVNQLVHCEDGSAVCDVMVAGEFVVRNRRLVHVRLEDLAVRGAAAAERLRAQNAEQRQLADRFAEILPGFCSGLARTCTCDRRLRCFNP